MALSPELGTERVARIGSAEVAYRERGSGDPLVFVHGLLTNGDLWRKVVPALSRSRRCIAPDWPLGSHSIPMPADADLSPAGLARLVAAFCDELELDSPTLVANDTGGAIAQVLVAEQPERLGRLVLTSCDAFENFLPPVFRYLQLSARVPGAMLAVAQATRLAAVRDLPIGYGRGVRRPLDPDAAESYLAPIRRSRAIRRDTAAVLRGISSRYTLEAARELGEFRGPVLLAWGDDDRLFPLDHAERLAELFPDARVEVVDGAAAFVPEDRPERLVELIEDFLGRPGGRSRPADRG